MLTLTPNAVDAIKAIVRMEELPESAGLRITAEPVEGEESYEIGLALEPEPQAGDEVVEEDGIRVFISTEAGALLDGKTLDAELHEDHLHFDIFDPDDDE